MGEIERIKRNGGAIKKRSLVEVVMAPVIGASTVLDGCRGAGGGANLVRQYQWHGVGTIIRFTAESLPIAVNLRATLPAPDAVRDAHDALDAALTAPSDAAFTEAAIAALLDSLGRKASANAALQLAGLSEVIGDDPAAEVLGLYPVHAAAPVVVAFGTRLLRQRAIYTPTPAEVAQACQEVHAKLEDGRAELFCYIILGEEVDDVIAGYGSEQTRDETEPRADEIPF